MGVRCFCSSEAAEAEKVFRVEAGSRQDIRELGLAFGERARLVDDQRGDLLQPFERLERSSRGRPTWAPRTDAHHDGHRRGQSEGAGAGDDEDRHGVDQRVREPWLRPKPQPQ